MGQREANAIESSRLSNSALEMASKGDFQGASASLRRAILLRPDYGVPHYNLGLILADSGDLNGAAKELIKAISLLPGQAKPWFDLGRVRDLQGKRESALASISWSAYLAPSNALIQAQLQSLRAERHAGASVSKTVISVRQPNIGATADTATAHFVFANELNRQGDVLGAIGELRRSLTLESTDIDVRRSLARNYEGLGDLNQAILEYYKVLLMVPGDAETHFAVGRMLLTQGHSQEAVKQFRLALSYRPDMIEARKLLDGTVRELRGR